MRRVRVVVVEDSLTVRRRLIDTLASDQQIEVIAAAKDGKEAIELCAEHRPDVITMDMMMPVMTGLAATEYIMAHYPTPILIVSASVNRGELFKIYDSLAAGAVDVLEKPESDEIDDDWNSRFLAMVKLISRIKVISHPRARLMRLSSAASNVQPAPYSAGAASNIAIIAIGASTGGPAAIAQVLREVPQSSRVPILVVLHMNEPFVVAFAEWLAGQIERCVLTPTDGAPVMSALGCVVLAPGGHHLVVRERRMFLTLDPERHSCRPSVDVLFESIATDYGASAAACLLTGMGKDGALGLLRIRQAGGFTIAQDESTSVVYGMPREAARLGAAMQILPVGNIGPRLASLQRGRSEAVQ